MNTKKIAKELIFGALFAIIGIICYIIAIMLPTPPAVGFLLVTIWPMSAIINAYILYKYISTEWQSLSNQLAMLFSIIAFVLAYIMLSIQIGLRTGIGELISEANADEKSLLETILYASEWVHLGVDLAWDMFLGMSLIFLALAIRIHPEFKFWWSIPMAILGLLVLIINLITFPHPPQTQGIFDIGPIVGTFMIAFLIRIIFMAIEIKKQNINT